MGPFAGYPARVLSVPAERAANTTVGCAGTTIVRMPNNRVSQQSFYPAGIDTGEATVRDSSNRRFRRQGFLPAGPRTFTPAADKPENPGPVLAINTISRRTKEVL
jgi:hypothetical protein